LKEQSVRALIHFYSVCSDTAIFFRDYLGNDGTNQTAPETGSLQSPEDFWHF